MDKPHVRLPSYSVVGIHTRETNRLKSYTCLLHRGQQLVKKNWIFNDLFSVSFSAIYFLIQKQSSSKINSMTKNDH